MSSVSYIFTGVSEVAKSGEGVPDVGEHAAFYHLLFTSIEPLFKVLTGEERSALEEISNSHDYSSITFIFSGEFRDALISIGVNETEDVASKWMADEDCPYENQSDTLDLLNALIKFATASKERNEQLFIRTQM